MNRIAYLGVVAALGIAMPSVAAAATASGRITYISSDGHHILVDNSDDYILGSAVDASKLNVAQSVRITYSEQNGKRTATAISSVTGS